MTTAPDSLIMFLIFLCLILVLSLSHGFGDDEKFITDILSSWEIDQCDLGHVSASEKTSISNEFIEKLNQR